MGLSRKTGLVIGAALGVLVLVVVAVCVTVVMDGYRRLEREFAVRNAVRLREAIAHLHTQLDVKASDWSCWDDTYAFMADQNPVFIDSNLNSESIAALGLWGMAFADNDGRVVMACGPSEDAGGVVETDAPFVELIGRSGWLSEPARIGAGVHGILRDGDVVALVAMRPILNSERRGPPRGTLVFAQRLDDAMVRELESLVQARVRLEPVAERGAGLLGPAVRTTASPDTITAETGVAGIDGSPAILASISMPRDITSTGRGTVRLTILLVLASGLALWLVMDRALRRLVLDRASRLSGQLSRIAVAGESALRVESDGADELGALADHINSVLGALDARAEELRHAREVAEAATEARSQFLAAMSHEVRSPLSALLGCAQLLEDESLSEARKRSELAAVLRNGRHMLSVVNDLLDHSKIQAGRMTVERIAFAPVGTVVEACEIQANAARAKGLGLAIHIGPGVPTRIENDPTRLRQILINLVGNAVKFTHTGSIEVDVRMEEHADTDAGAERCIAVDVRDTGIGMGPEQLAHLFTPYTQGDAGTPRNYGGTGLGLSISRSLARQMGGDLTATSTRGQGSTFSLRLACGLQKAAGEIGIERSITLVASDGSTPARPAEPATPVAPSSRSVPAPGPTSPGPLAGLRILVVDDCDDNRRLIAHHLERAGAEVASVGDAASGLELVGSGMATRRARFDAVLLDLHMPETGGAEAARRLRKDGYAGVLLAVTASSGMEMDECLEAGFGDILQKPIDRATLVDAVLRAMKRPAKAA
ncbi:MAG: CHASE4 domain-containing protein [Phycisphaerales bacterium]